MRHSLLVAALLAAMAGSAFASGHAPYEKKLSPDIPGETYQPRIQTTPERPLPDLRPRAQQAAAQPAAPGVALPPVAAGVPQVPASDPNAPEYQAPTTARFPQPAPPAAESGPSSLLDNPVPAAPPLEPSAQVTPPGHAPGVPVPVYRTMAEAAKAGVDPLGEHLKAPEVAVQEPVSEPAKLPPIAKAAKPALVLDDSSTWKAYAMAHEEQLYKFGLPGLGVLFLLLILARRRRAASSEEDDE